MVEFADFQCSYCRREEPVVAHLGTVYGADLRLVFKHLPLTPIHDHAEHAAIAAECAGEQGKFWELHDLLLTTELDDATLLDDARAIPGLDVTAWQACLTSSEAAAVVDADLALAATVGIPGTPTFVVNGVLVVGAVPEDELRAAIGQARARAIASGIPRADYYDKAVMGP
jgi:protein-disulfide isomerase